MDCLVNRIMCQSLNQVQPEGGVVNEIRERYVEIRNQLIDNAKKNKMMPFIAKMLLDAGIDSTYWNDVLKEYRLRNSNAKAELIAILECLGQNGICAYPIENFASLILTGADLAMFASGDIDIYVQSREYERVNIIMQGLGYFAESRSEICGDFYRKPGVEIGFNMMWIWQARENCPMETKLEENNLGVNAEIADWVIDGIEVGLGIMGGGGGGIGADELMYMCLVHSSVHYYAAKPGLRLYYDICLLGKQNINWNQVYRYAEADGYLNRVAASAYFACERVHAVVPEEFYSSIIGTDRRAKRLVDFINKKWEANTLYADFTIIHKIFIESFSNDECVVKTIYKMLFPNRLWINRKYHGDSYLKNWLKHVACLLRGTG